MGVWNFWDIRKLKDARYDLQLMSDIMTRMIDNNDYCADQYNYEGRKWTGKSYDVIRERITGTFKDDAIEYRGKIESAMDTITEKIRELEDE